MNAPLLLSQANEFQSFNITRIQTPSAMRVRLLGIGLNVGNTISILRNRKGDIVLRNGHNRLSLGQGICNKIIIEPISAT